MNDGIGMATLTDIGIIADAATTGAIERSWPGAWACRHGRKRALLVCRVPHIRAPEPGLR